MQLNEFLENISNACAFIENEGYDLRNVDRNFWYERHTNEDGLRISFAWTQYGEEFHVFGVDCLKRFNSVEQEIQKALGGELMDYYTIYKNPQKDYIPEGLPVIINENNIRFIVKDVKDIKIFSEFVKQFYHKEVKVFFDTYKTIGDVDQWLKTNETNLHKYFIVPTQNTMMVRKLLLMCLTKDVAFKDLYVKYKAFLEQKNNEQESPYVDMYAVFKVIDNYLSAFV